MHPKLKKENRKNPPLQSAKKKKNQKLKPILFNYKNQAVTSFESRTTQKFGFVKTSQNLFQAGITT